MVVHGTADQTHEMNPANTHRTSNSDRALHVFQEMSLDDMYTPVATCVANLFHNIEAAREAADEAEDAGDMQAQQYLLTYVGSLEPHLKWLARWWKDRDCDESVLVADAFLSHRLFVAKTDLIQGHRPGASDEAKDAAEDALGWATSDYDGPGNPADYNNGVSIMRMARALGMDVDALRRRLLTEAGLKEEASWYSDAESTSAPESQIWETPHVERDKHRNLIGRGRKAPIKGADIRGTHALANTETLAQTAAIAATAAAQKAATALRLDVLLVKATATVEVVKAVAVSTVCDQPELVRRVATTARGKAARIFKWARKGVTAAVAMLVSGGAQADGPVKYDQRTGVEASNNVALATYVMQSAAFLQPRTEQEKEVKQCVAKLTDLAPGGGDAFSQQRAVSSEIALSQIMLRGLGAARGDTSAAADCHWHLSNLSIRTQDPSGEVHVNRAGQAVSPSFRGGASDQVGRRLICASALGDVSRGVLEELKASPMVSEAQAVEVARRHIAKELRPAATRVYQADKKILSVPVLMADGNAGSTKPYAPVSRGGLIIAPMGEADEKDGAKYVGDQVSSLAQQTTDVSTIAVGGFLAWTTSRTDSGLAAKYDGASFSVSRNGMPLFDASTIDGATSRVSIAANGSFTSSSPQLAGRTEQLSELATCALAMNNLAQQLTPRLLKPKMVPPASSKATQALLHRADFAQAVAQARSVTQAGPLQTDYSDGGMRWRIGPFGFAKNGGASRSGVQVTLGGAVFFDDTHIAGQSYTINASASDSSSTAYFGN